MGFFSTIFGFFGFGVGISIGLVVGYFLFIYFQPTDVEVFILNLEILIHYIVYVVFLAYF